VDARHKAGHDDVLELRQRFDGLPASAQDGRNGTGFARQIHTGGNIIGDNRRNGCRTI
jgi:hypothetical protein